jgi:protein O-mannosyl-transferase
VRWVTRSIGVRPAFLSAFVLLWTLIVFKPVLRNDFVNWDDFRMFLENVEHKAPWESRILAAWTSHRLGEYMPVTWMTFAVDRSFWRDDPAGYHFTSVLLHATAAIVVLFLARRLLRIALGPGPEGSAGLWGGATVAALAFAVHPMRVEPVQVTSARSTRCQAATI